MTQMSGIQFATLLTREVAAKNNGLNRLSYAALGRSCGVSGRYLRVLSNGGQNPSSLIIRLVLFTLGYHIDSPEHDVLPHLKEQGCYRPELHDPKKKRRPLRPSGPSNRADAMGFGS